MSQHALIEIGLPTVIDKFRLPEGVSRRRRVTASPGPGDMLTKAERKEVERLVNLADLLSLLRLRAQREAKREPSGQ
jgi:hypothetical protein